ncbi:hypothetical protein SAMN06265182_0203 [Persephonella hydrogeniphila]|uniref:Uncharacterized protein n=1 Tax=Persephonella hydrogeniphila TaxID=198703 RepID=A0A285N1V3_9AQUI|nr:hypothetical protein [Persephonella hydrogeniphila]SNZ02757.1 hypothetical protein SAMN06265182_0203 [Persephonella hydrogeniphila]
MEKTPYAIDFLWNQIEIGYKEIRKNRYKTLVKEFLFNPKLREKAEKLRDKKSGRNYEGGLLERTASTLSIALCIYDNYPEIDIDLILTAIILNLFCGVFPKKECYEKIKDYPEVVQFLFLKSRKKPSIEITVYDSIIKLDTKIFMKLQKFRKINKER